MQLGGVRSSRFDSHLQLCELSKVFPSAGFFKLYYNFYGGKVLLKLPIILFPLTLVCKGLSGSVTHPLAAISKPGALIKRFMNFQDRNPQCF